MVFSSVSELISDGFIVGLPIYKIQIKMPTGKLHFGAFQKQLIFRQACIKITILLRGFRFALIHVYLNCDCDI